MFGDIEFSLRKNLQDREYAEEYAAAFLNAYVSTQIKVIREQRGMTQADLANRIGTTQAGVSRYENVNYSSWSLRTLMKLARAFDVRLRVSFEPYGTLPDEVVRFDRARLQTIDRENDPGVIGSCFEIESESDHTVNIGAYKALAGNGQIDQGRMGENSMEMIAVTKARALVMIELDALTNGGRFVFRIVFGHWLSVTTFRYFPRNRRN